MRFNGRAGRRLGISSWRKFNKESWRGEIKGKSKEYGKNKQRGKDQRGMQVLKLRTEGRVGRGVGIRKGAGKKKGKIK